MEKKQQLTQAVDASISISCCGFVYVCVSEVVLIKSVAVRDENRSLLTEGKHADGKRTALKLHC